MAYARPTPTRRAAQRRSNGMVQGTGASTTQDRGAHQSITQYSSNPYFSNNALYRWGEYTRLYMTAWEARKVIDIPVEDALRKDFELHGISEAEAKELKDAYTYYNCDHQLRRALIQERLYGGSCIFPVLGQREGTTLSSTLPQEEIRKGDLKSLNVVDISLVTKPKIVTDPFSEFYDKAVSYDINGVTVDTSRLIVLDGSPLLNRASRLISNRFGNYAGFGESKLAPLYDLLIRVIGTQQGAYHLVNLASVLIVEVERLQSLGGSCSPAIDYLKQFAEQISMYRAGVLDQKAKLTQHAASFGGVPELMMQFAQFLAAASDISATRFLGQSPGGLNSSGESDSENYYNMVDSYSAKTVTPTRRKMLDFVASSLWGPEAWAEKSKTLEIVQPSLWNLSDKEQAEVDNIYATLIANLVMSNALGAQEAIEELKARDIFKTDLEAQKFIENPLRQPEEPANPEQTLAELEAAGVAA